MKKVLVCEDEQNIREFVVINLKRAGYETLEAENGDEALALYREAEEKPNLAILDIMMPGKHDGLAVCRELRRLSDAMGIILLSAKTQESDKVNGLVMGADDYVTKPFSPSELVARVDAVYRRVKMADSQGSGFQENLRSGKFTLNLRSHTFTKNDHPVELTQVEFQIMEYFFESSGAALSRTEILHRVWGSGYTGEEKIVDVNIRRLRMKVEDEPSNPSHILTVWGYGYRWEP